MDRQEPNNYPDDTKLRRPSAVAGLLHGFTWKILEPEIELSPGVRLGRLERSAVGDLYHRACEQRFIDDADPFGYEAYILLELSEDFGRSHSFGDCDGTIERISNVIALAVESPVGMCRGFTSSDLFRTYENTVEVYSYGYPIEALSSNWESLDDSNKRYIRALWSEANRLWNCAPRGRVTSALTYFYLAWRSHIFEQTCINLAICVEILFAPHTQSETSHQISFNVSRFFGASAQERESIYTQVKKFYGLRSTIVHGGKPDDDRVWHETREMFFLCAKILKKILLEANVSEQFEDEKKRKDLLKQYLFS